jgi:hypothetical protein
VEPGSADAGAAGLDGSGALRAAFSSTCACSEQTPYRPRIGSSGHKPKRHGFLVVSRATRWRVCFIDDTPSEWSDKWQAEELLGKWRGAAADMLSGAKKKVEKAREEFIDQTQVEVILVANPNPFQVDDRKPTVTFPDGSTIQFPEETPQNAIDEEIRNAAKEAHPDPSPQDVTGASAELESVRVWERELLEGGRRLPYPDILAWDHHFPMADVAQTLDELAREGWSVLEASEDRGLFCSDLAESVSAPLTVRYLLAREDGSH